MSPASPHKPAYNAPTKRPDWDGPDALEALKHHLQTAVLVELHTIPIYLYAAYSIKEGDVSHIITIAKQEMLHLGLAGNILRSIGGTPKLHGEDFTPKYPADIFYESRVKLEMKAATPEHIQTFVDLEAPTPQAAPFMRMNLILEDYVSIGQFYQEVMRGLQIVDEKYKAEGKSLFDPKSIPFQFNSTDGSWHAEDMAAIKDFEGAAKAMEFIIEQGEGTTGTASLESHYNIFKKMAEEKLVLYPLVDNPRTSDYVGKKIHKAMIAYDAAYSYLLLTIERMWQYDGDSRINMIDKNIRRLMERILRPLAHLLVAQPLENGKNAGPPHNLYVFLDAAAYTPLVELRELIAAALAEFPGNGLLSPIEPAVGDLYDLPKRK